MDWIWFILIVANAHVYLSELCYALFFCLTIKFHKIHAITNLNFMPNQHRYITISSDTVLKTEFMFPFALAINKNEHSMNAVTIKQ